MYSKATNRFGSLFYIIITQLMSVKKIEYHRNVIKPLILNSNGKIFLEPAYKKNFRYYRNAISVIGTNADLPLTIPCYQKKVIFS